MLARLAERLDPDLRAPGLVDWLAQRWPGSPWTEARHLRYLATLLEELPGGARLIVNLPPRHGKTQLVSVRFVAWRLIRDPTLRVILCTHTQTLAESLSRQIRRIVRDAGVILDPEYQRLQDWRTAAGGGVRAAGVGAAIAGFGAELLVVDDPHRNREAADSIRERDHLWEWWHDDFLTRAEPGAQVIVVMTRFHIDDLVGRILAHPNGRRWTVVRLPALADDSSDPLGRQPNEPLWPERFSEHELVTIRVSVDHRTWMALYQQQPQTVATVTIDPSWFPRYDPQHLPHMVGRWISWDTAEGGETGAYSVAWVADLGEDGALYLRERVRVRLPFTELTNVALALARAHAPAGLREILVERASTGGALYDVLQRELARHGLNVGIIGIRPTASKLVRAEAASVAIRAGLVSLPAAADWLDDFFRELMAFPHGPYADQVDSLTQLVTYLAHWLGERHEPVEMPRHSFGRGGGR